VFGKRHLRLGGVHSGVFYFCNLLNFCGGTAGGTGIPAEGLRDCKAGPPTSLGGAEAGETEAPHDAISGLP
jgi:hypothetical protein